MAAIPPTPGPGPVPPLPDPEPPPPEDVRASNPNAGGRLGLAGDMGVSSERLPHDPRSIEGTGSRGTATHAPDGVWPTMNDAHVEQEPEPLSKRELINATWVRPRALVLGVAVLVLVGLLLAVVLVMG
jgi:hypothetical protein